MMRDMGAYAIHTSNSLLSLDGILGASLLNLGIPYLAYVLSAYQLLDLRAILTQKAVRSKKC